MGLHRPPAHLRANTGGGQIDNVKTNLGGSLLKDGEFKRPTVLILSSRAANMCSNPDCAAITSGASSDGVGAIIVGEAAHIYGGKLGSARYKEAMTDEERSDPTNGIWLCRNCHKQVDADPKEYPPGLLFEWKRSHEAHVLSRLGKAGDMRSKVQERLLSVFPGAGYQAEQTIIDKPEFWEYKLTAQLLRQFLEPLEARLLELNDGFYALPITSVERNDCRGWTMLTGNNIANQVRALTRLIQVGLPRAWGADGAPGSDREIYAACRLIRDACDRLITIEECIRYTELDEAYEDVLPVMNGVVEPLVREIFNIPLWIGSVFADENPQGLHELKVTFALPDGWPERLIAAIKKGMSA